MFTTLAGAEGRGVCGAKRIRSLYLPWMTGVPPKLSTITPPERPGLRLDYQWRDYAPLQSRPSLPHAIPARLEAAPTGQETGRKIFSTTCYHSSTVKSLSLRVK